MSNPKPYWIPTDAFEAMEHRVRKARRKRIVGRIVLYVVSATIGLGVGTALVNATTPDSDAASQTEINQFIRAHGGIPPCKWEDGSGQPGMCYWDASERGNGHGYDYIAVPTKPGQDKQYVYLTGPKAQRY